MPRTLSKMVSTIGAMRVLALVTAPIESPGERIRVRQYVAPLRGYGIEMALSTFWDEPAHAVLHRRGHVRAKAAGVARGLLRRLRDVAIAKLRYDLVLVYREGAPVGSALVERALRSLNIPYVYDFDEALFVRAPYSANDRWQWLRPAGRVAASARGAVAVIVQSELLAEHARQWNSRVTVIPSPVDSERHRPLDLPSNARPVVGWVGSATTAPYLHLLDDVLGALARSRAFDVRVIGGPYSHPVAAVELRPWSLVSEPEDIARFDIGVLPEPDDMWTRGKGAFKALLYMAAGRPVVASRVGLNADIVENGVTGFVVSTAEEWIEALTRLLDDESLRVRMGLAGRERVVRDFSLNVMAAREARALREALAVHRATSGTP